MHTLEHRAVWPDRTAFSPARPGLDGIGNGENCARTDEGPTAGQALLAEFAHPAASGTARATPDLCLERGQEEQFDFRLPHGQYILHMFRTVSGHYDTFALPSLDIEGGQEERWVISETAGSKMISTFSSAPGHKLNLTLPDLGAESNEEQNLDF